MDKFTEMKQKLKQFHDMNNQYLKEIMTLIKEKRSEEVQIVSYFTYSLNISHMNDGESFCLGSYHIFNISNRPINNPYICIKLTPASLFEFSGKYFYKDAKQKMKFANSWERMNDPTDKEEFWLKPNDIVQLEPFQKLAFSDFQIKWNPTSSYAGSILGFTYADEIKEGIHSLNQINLSGKFPKEDVYESS